MPVRTRLVRRCRRRRQRRQRTIGAGSRAAGTACTEQKADAGAMHLRHSCAPIAPRLARARQPVRVIISCLPLFGLLSLYRRQWPNAHELRRPMPGFGIANRSIISNPPYHAAFKKQTRASFPAFILHRGVASGGIWPRRDRNCFSGANHHQQRHRTFSGDFYGLAFRGMAPCGLAIFRQCDEKEMALLTFL